MEKIKFYFNEKLNINMIADTFKAAFNQKFDKEYWIWRFLNNPNDEKVYISYIIKEGTLVAYYAVSPSIIKIENKKYKIALSNMTMTHPDFQGRGYFKNIATALYDELKKEGYIGVYGFANANSHYGFRKNLGWNDLASLNVFRVLPENFKSFLMKSDNSEFSVNDVSKDIILKNDNLKTSNSLVCVNRTTANFIWRLNDIPNQKYRILEVKNENKTQALIIFKFYGKQIDIIEFLYSNKREFDKENLLIQSVFYLISNYNSQINIWSNLHSKEHIILEKFGFEETVFNTYFGVIPFTKNDKITNIKNWHYRFYDSDVF